MIDINELRRLTQAATPGPWVATTVVTAVGVCHKVGPFPGKTTEHPPRHACLYVDYDSAYNPADREIYANAALIAAANPAAISELLDRIEAAERERDTLRAKIEAMEKQEPVAWRTFDGEGGYDYRNVEDNEDYQAVWEARNPSHKGWVEPLYALPGAKRRMKMIEPKLKEGEIYVATIQIVGQDPYHLTLLPDHPKDEMTHQAATEWAASLGGDLPTRPEQALLFAYQREQFDRDWNWSNTLHESVPDYAWCQTFGFGGQGYYDRHIKLRARAVRREYF